MLRLLPKSAKSWLILFSLLAVTILLINNLLVIGPSSSAQAAVSAPKRSKPGAAEAWRALRMRDENGSIPADGLIKARQHVSQMPRLQKNAPGLGGITGGGWTQLGPGSTGGRIRAVVIHPTNPNITWIGSTSGGIWKTTDGGANWFPLNDFLPNMAVASLVIDPTNPNVLYAGTGEQGFYDLYPNLQTSAITVHGGGIFKTTDGGLTWNQLEATIPSDTSPQWYFVNKLAITPGNGQVLLAGTRNGIYRSADGGNSWSLTTGISDTIGPVFSVQFHPTDPNQAVAATGNGTRGNAWYSTNGGQSWVSATPGDWFAAAELAYAKSNPNIVYASVGNNGGEVWRSANGGHSYTKANTGTFAYLYDPDWANAIWVDPTNPNNLVVGGLDLYRSTNGGVTLTQISDWQQAPGPSVHADHHFIVSPPDFDGNTNRTVYFANDGGMYKTTNVYNVAIASGWQVLNNNLAITQFYSLASGSTGKITGGTQDNGSLLYTGAGAYQANWGVMAGGDGSFSAFDPTDPNYFYGGYYGLFIHRNTTGGASPDVDLPNQPPDTYAGTTNFIAPFVLDPNNPNVMLAGGGDLWRSTNIKAASPAWTSIKSGPGYPDNISAIAIARGNSDNIWVGHNNGELFHTTNGTAATPTWTQIPVAAGLPARYVTRIVVDPNNPNQVYVLYGGYSANNIWRTGDGGATWASLSGAAPGNLPSVPFYTLAIHPTNPGWLYLGTEMGVFTSQNGGANWYTAQDGPANVPVEELIWLDNAPTLAAATYGRGIFKTSLCANPLTVTKTTDDGSCGTLRMALGNATSNATIDLSALPTGTVFDLKINLGLSTPPGVTNVTLKGGPCDFSGQAPIIINGLNISGDVLTLRGSGTISGIKIIAPAGGKGRSIYVPGGSNWKFGSCVQAGKL